MKKKLGRRNERDGLGPFLDVLHKLKKLISFSHQSIVILLVCNYDSLFIKQSLKAKPTKDCSALFQSFQQVKNNEKLWIPHLSLSLFTTICFGYAHQPLGISHQPLAITPIGQDPINPEFSSLLSFYLFLCVACFSAPDIVLSNPNKFLSRSIIKLHVGPFFSF